jgi:hypothetical protein
MWFFFNWECKLFNNFESFFLDRFNVIFEFLNFLDCGFFFVEGFFLVFCGVFCYCLYGIYYRKLDFFEIYCKKFGFSEKKRKKIVQKIMKKLKKKNWVFNVFFNIFKISDKLFLKLYENEYNRY